MYSDALGSRARIESREQESGRLVDCPVADAMLDSNAYNTTPARNECGASIISPILQTLPRYLTAKKYATGPNAAAASAPATAGNP